MIRRIMMKYQAFQFLSKLPPFTFLPEEELHSIAAEVSYIHFPKDTELFVQGKSRVEYLYVIHKGAVERYYRDDDREILREFLAEGDIFGGVSMLLHAGLSARSMRTRSDTDFYILPKKRFLDICAHYGEFSDYFTDLFGKLMLDKSFAAIIAKDMCPADEVVSTFYNEPVEDICARDPVFCYTDTTIQDAAATMSRRHCSSILVRSPGGDFVGIMTDNDLRRVIGTGCDIKKRVTEVMSSPLGTIPARAPIFEALMSMMQRRMKHLAVTDAAEKVVGMLTVRDIIVSQGDSALFLLREIDTAQSVEEIADKRTHLPRLIEKLIKGGAKAESVAKLVSTISDTILKRIISFALQELGQPPVKFVFLILGSEGRKEQTLKTDQDNAIMFEDVPGEFFDGVKQYFLRFGDLVCTWLDQAGYRFCKGEVMARNPQWCQPFSVWNEYFTTWIATVEPMALLQSNIFFDYRAGYGDLEMAARLRRRLFDLFKERPNFFRYLTENTLNFKPPLGFFGNFIVESKGEHRDTFDIKTSMTTIVNFARAYALFHGIEETNTPERLNQLFLKNVLSRHDYHELEQSYSYLLQLRFVRQVTAVIKENSEPDNHINPKTLSRIEQTMLREIFKSIEKFQRKMSFDFTGIAN
jgi:CBS domain-containing protein